MSGNIPVEPTADQRMMALAMRQLFVAYIGEGFTEDQALRLIGFMLTAPGGAEA